MWSALCCSSSIKYMPRALKCDGQAVQACLRNLQPCPVDVLQCNQPLLRCCSAADRDECLPIEAINRVF